MQIPYDVEIRFLESVTTTLLTMQNINEEEKQNWLNNIKSLYGQYYDILMLTYHIPFVTLEKVTQKINELKAQLESQKIRELEIVEAEVTKRKEIEIVEAEVTKRKEIEIRETETTKRKEIEIRETETTKRLKIEHEINTSSPRYDFTSKYIDNIWSGRESLTTEFETIFGNNRSPFEYSGIISEMPWLDQTSTKESDFQNLFNTFLKNFGTEVTGHSRLIIYNQTSGLYYCDTHSSPDGLVRENKPDTTIYLNNRNGEYPGPNLFKFCFSIELQLGYFDKEHVHALIKRSEIIMDRTPQRSYLYTLWLTETLLVVHKVQRNDVMLNHKFSTPASLSDDRGKKILHFFLNCSDPHFFGVPSLPQDIENYLNENQLFPDDLLGVGTYSQVLKISSLNDSRKFALKIYKSSDENHMSLKDDEVRILRKLNHITYVPSILFEGTNSILLDKVCEPLKAEQITGPFVDKLLAALDQVHNAGVIWGDCRPDNIGIVNGEPLLIDWNLAIERDHFTHPHNGTRCFVPQRLLRASPNQFLQRVPDDDKESLLKSLIGILHPKIRNIVNNVNDPAERADTWARHYKTVTLPMNEAFSIFKMNLSSV